MNERYEKRKKDLWVLMCTNDEGDENKHRVISYFCSRTSSDPENIGNVVLEAPVHDYKHVMTTSEVRVLLDKKYRSKRFWENNKHMINTLSSLENYVSQAEQGNFSKVLLTSTEVACILPKNTKK